LFKEHCKLVRDRIPEIIKESGDKPKFIVLTRDARYYEEVKKKIAEEARELCSAERKEEVVDEIVDIQELIDILLAALGMTKSELRTLQRKKNKERGGFKNRIFLMWTE